MLQLKRTRSFVGLQAAFAVVISLGMLGCTAVLPSESNLQKYPWATYDEVKTAYNSVELEKTNVQDLKGQGFDPDDTSNIAILSYLDVVKRFSPILKKEDLPSGVQKCIEVKEQCKAFVASPSVIQRQRVGNAALDLLGFRQETVTTGWKFEAVFVMIDDIVTYKLWNGTPDIETYGSRVQPLGPAQSLGGLFSP